MPENRRNLFVCIGNVDRSVAAANLFEVMLKEQGFSVGKLEDKEGFDFYVASAGIRVSAPNIINGSRQLTRKMSDWAERIFSLDERVTPVLIQNYSVARNRIQELYVEDGRSLLIEDQANELYAELRRKLGKYLPK